MLSRLARWWLLRRGQAVDLRDLDAAIERGDVIDDLPTLDGRVFDFTHPDFDGPDWPSVDDPEEGDPLSDDHPIPTGECVCGRQVMGRDWHLVVATPDDDDDLGMGGGGSAMSADFCADHCPGGCRWGCVPSRP